MAPKILVVLTSAGSFSDGKPTGWYLPEFAHPYDVLASKAEIIIASPKGGEAPLDPSSIEAFKDDPSSAAFLESKSALWKNTKPLADFAGRSGEFDALFFPGGHGPMYDLAKDETSMQLTADFYAAGKPIAAVCHGVIALAYVKLANGDWLLKGKEVTGFSNEEEDIAGKTDLMPFLLEDALIASSKSYVKASKPWGEKIVVDGNIITGQNPASAKGVGEAIAKALGI